MQVMRALLLALTACATTTSQADPHDGPVVVELFTSQGCSSCPPADKLLGEIAKSGQVAGRKVAPLAFHVDYWNELGWADPYSAPQWTQRQQQYATDRVYTPELVVAGGEGVVGSQTPKVLTAIGNAPRQALLPAHATWSANKVEVTATAPADADAYVAVYETETSTDVKRGENGGSTLPSAHVVRALVRVAKAGTTATISVPTAWAKPGAIAFAQRADHRIVAAALL